MNSTLTMTQESKPIGRPTDYSEDTADRICEHLASGNSLISFCRDNDLGYSTVTQWLRRYPDFAAKYTLARESQADFHADEIIDIADDMTIQPDQKRVQIDARKWKAGKMKPKVYGEKFNAQISDADGAPISFTLGISPNAKND